jgi:hypothetical protein
MVELTRRSRLFRMFKPKVDGLLDKARDTAERSEAEQFDRDWYGGAWQKSHPFSYDLEIVERMSGNPLSVLSRAVDGVHTGEIVSVALVAVGSDGVIHSAWSDGNYRLMGHAAEWMSNDLKKAAK